MLNGRRLLSAWLFLTGLLSPAGPLLPLIIAFENYPPDEFMGDDEARGMNVDIIRQVLEAFGVEYEFKIYPLCVFHQP